MFSHLPDALRKLVSERMNLVIEPSSNVTAAALFGKLEIKDRRVGIIPSGGTLDLGRFFDGR